MASQLITGTSSKWRLQRRLMALGACLSMSSISGGAQASPDSAPASSNASSNEAGPAPSKEQCVEWHKRAQLAQNEVKLVEARELSRMCTALACPGLIINDCARWLNDLDQRLPSVVFEVRVDGEPDMTATVTADGKRVEEWTRGEALRLDPGEHQFRVELGKYEPIVRKVLLAEGMRYRVITIDFKSSSLQQSSSVPPKAAAPPDETPRAPGARHLPAPFYPLLGVGAAGVVSFVVFSLVGKSKQHDLENTCKPNCTDSDLKPMKTSYLIGDISLGVGVASLAAAGVFYFRADRKSASTTSIGLVRLPGGGAAEATYRF